MNIKKNILKVLSANLLTLLSSLVIGFIVPAILSVESYALVKTYTFYISYTGLMHLGFIDAMYIKYGGKDVKNINKNEIKSEHNTFILMQLMVTFIILNIAIYFKDIILFLLSISIIPINVGNFHKLFYQATGQFNIYSKVSYIHTVIYLVINIILAIVIGSDNFILYCIATIIAYGVVFIILEYKFFSNMKDIKGKLDINLFTNIKIGFFILLGNLAVNLFYASDRWFIKLFFDVDDFAYYSFALSILNIINTVVGAVSITFYNYLSQGEDSIKLKKLKLYFIILGTFSSCGYFVFAGIITLFLSKYYESLSIIAISFASYPYVIIINVLYINLYKSRKNEKRYVQVVFIMLIISVIYNTLATLLFESAVAITFATTLSFITWYIYSQNDFKFLKNSFKENFYLLMMFIVFLFCSHFLDWISGGIVYLIVLSVATLLIFRNETKEMISIILNKR